MSPTENTALHSLYSRGIKSAGLIGVITIVKSLLRRKSQLPYDENPPWVRCDCAWLIWAGARSGSTDIVQIGLNCENPDLNKVMGSIDGTPLQLAAGRGHTEVVRLLLKHGARYTGFEVPPIARAAKRGFLGPVKVLLDAGADINEGGEGGQNTALILAAAVGQNHIVRYLLDHGANITAGEVGSIALGKATDKGWVDTVATLRDAGAILQPSGTDANRDQNA